MQHNNFQRESISASDGPDERFSADHIENDSIADFRSFNASDTMGLPNGEAAANKAASPSRSVPFDNPKPMTTNPVLSSTRDDRTLLTVKELAQILQTSVTSVYRVVARREIGFHRLPRGLRFSKEDLEAYLKDRRTERVIRHAYASEKS